MKILGKKVIENVNVGHIAFTAVSDYLGFKLGKFMVEKI